MSMEDALVSLCNTPTLSLVFWWCAHMQEEKMATGW